MCFAVLRTVWNESTNEKEALERTACSGKKDRKDSRGRGENVNLSNTHQLQLGVVTISIIRKAFWKGEWYSWEVVPFQTLPDATYSEGLQTMCPLGDG